MPLHMGNPTKHYWPYYLDAEGHFWNSDGIELDDPETILFFMKGMEPLSDGRYQVFCQGEECRITVEDVPYVVRDLDFFQDHITLKFSGNYSELLDPLTLYVGKKNVLYCKIRGGKFKARFNRSSYMELAKKIKFDPKTKTYYLPLDKKKYMIRGV